MPTFLMLLISVNSNSVINYIKETFNTDNNTAATIFITLFVFITGFLLNELRKWVSKLLEYRNYKKLFKDIIQEISRTTQNQSEYFKEFYPQLTIKYRQVYHLKSRTITHLESFDKLHLPLLHASYFHWWINICGKFRRKAFNMVINSIALLNELEYSYPNEMEKFMNIYNKYEDIWNENVNLLRQIHDEIISDTQGKSVQGEYNEYLKDMDLLWVKWQKNENRVNYDVLKETLLIPLLELNRDHPKIKIGTIMNNYILMALNSYDNMIAWLKVNQKKFQILSFNYRAISIKTRTAIKILNTNSLILAIIKTHIFLKNF